MELLNEAIHNNNFGLRREFQWSSVTADCNKLQREIRWQEEAYLKSLLRPVFPNGKLGIQRIENPYLWGRYVLQYEEMKSETHSQHVREQIMIHGTTYANAKSISERNFDWRLVNRSRFGRGVSFTSDAEYAKCWATNSNVYIVAGVLVANSSPGDWHQKLPFNKDDTTTGYTQGVCIKYYDNDFYPYYIVK